VFVAAVSLVTKLARGRVGGMPVKEVGSGAEKCEIWAPASGAVPTPDFGDGIRCISLCFAKGGDHEKYHGGKFNVSKSLEAEQVIEQRYGEWPLPPTKSSRQMIELELPAAIRHNRDDHYLPFVDKYATDEQCSSGTLQDVNQVFKRAGSALRNRFEMAVLNARSIVFMVAAATRAAVKWVSRLEVRKLLNAVVEVWEESRGLGVVYTKGKGTTVKKPSLHEFRDQLLLQLGGAQSERGKRIAEMHAQWWVHWEKKLTKLHALATADELWLYTARHVVAGIQATIDKLEEHADPDFADVAELEWAMVTSDSCESFNSSIKHAGVVVSNLSMHSKAGVGASQQMHMMQSKQEKEQRMKRRASGDRSTNARKVKSRGSGGGEQTGGCWDMTSYADIPEEERQELYRSLVKTHRKDQEQARQRETGQKEAGRKRLQTKQEEAVRKRAKQSDEWEASRGVVAARGVQELKRQLEAAPSSAGGQCQVYRDQISVRTKRYGRSLKELRHAAGSNALIGSGKNKAELTRLEGVFGKILEWEKGHPLPAEQPRPRPLALRPQPLFPDSQAASMDKKHQSAVEAAVGAAALALAAVAQGGEFCAARSEQPPQKARMQRERRRQRGQQQSDQQKEVDDLTEELGGEEWSDDDPDDSGEFVVLQAAWDEEFSQVIVYYFDKAAAAADGKSRDDLLRDLQHRSVLYSNVHDVVEWINNRK
jgi:hypothetical protein